MVAGCQVCEVFSTGNHNTLPVVLIKKRKIIPTSSRISVPDPDL